jgi:hypothetical protein
MDNDKIYESLINILKLFKNRPYHLAKYLMDNKSLSDSFLKKLSKSNFSKSDLNFKSISEMNDYFNSLLDDIDLKNKEESVIEINKKLDKLISEEKYEEAIYIRDYMLRNKIRRISN